MSTSDRAFNQVKEILEKLDRSIDAARSKRLHVDEPHEERTAAPERATESTRGSLASGGLSTPSPAPERGPESGSGLKARPLGRAKPLRAEWQGSKGESGWSSWGQESVG